MKCVHPVSGLMLVAFPHLGQVFEVLRPRLHLDPDIFTQFILVKILQALADWIEKVSEQQFINHDPGPLIRLKSGSVLNHSNITVTFQDSKFFHLSQS